MMNGLTFTNILLIYVTDLVMYYSGNGVTLVEAVNSWHRGIRGTGWKLPQENKNIRYARNEAECFLGCMMENSNCGAIYFRKAEQLCKHLYGQRTNLRGGTSNDVVIFAPRLKSFYATTGYSSAGGTFDYPDAVSMCEQFDARLSNRTELQEMYDDGVKHCWCGWLKDGTQGYVNQGQLNWCSTTPGVFYDCSQTLAHAWCTII